MSRLWKPTGANLILSPLWMVIALGKNALTSAPSFSNAFWLAGGRPMSTVLLEAWARPAGTRISAAVASATRWTVVSNVPPWLDRNYVAVTVTCMNGCKRQKNVYVPGDTMRTWELFGSVVDVVVSMN